MRPRNPMVILLQSLSGDRSAYEIMGDLYLNVLNGYTDQWLMRVGCLCGWVPTLHPASSNLQSRMACYSFNVQCAEWTSGSSGSLLA